MPDSVKGAPAGPLRLTLDCQALADNWRWLAAQSGTAQAGAAVKANGYGLGAAEALKTLAEAGARVFFVATWAEAVELAPLASGLELHVLHGVRDEDMALAGALDARPVLNSADQVRRWREQGGNRPCSVMVDTGMNRLGISVSEVASGLLQGLNCDLVLSHLACADEDVAMNRVQLDRFAGIGAHVPGCRMSLANSAGISLGRDYHFDLTRPGLSLYGGIARPEAQGHIRPVARIDAQLLQRRTLLAGESLGYNATFTAAQPMELAILNLGYADGYWRGFSGRGRALAGDVALPVMGRVSMDLTAICVDAMPTLREGDWVQIDFELSHAAQLSGMSQYELLTGLGNRFERRWA